AALDNAALPQPAAATDGPPAVARWADRDPDAAARLVAARTVLAETGEHWNIPLENLLQPDLLRRLCWTPPTDGDVAGVLRKGGAREWQIELLGSRLETALVARAG
ncbi:MAG: ribonuclease D, partial [Actinomycetes bacterium]